MRVRRLGRNEKDAMKLEELRPKQALVGVVPGCVVTVVQVEMVGADACLITYRLPEGGLGERQVFRSHEAELHEPVEARPWSFTGEPDDFQLAVEALRIRLAHLFDPRMAVHTSNVDPLPHQITAVYESLLPRQPLRFVLADDPGAGKTIMAGLYIRELIMRADSQRILVVAPGSLVEQWRDELREKFELDFKVYCRELEQASSTNNAFESNDRLIARLDQLSRSTDLQDLACARPWDLVIFDEAHKLAAHFFGQKTKETARFKFAMKMGDHTRHLLLMTATPHNGKEEDFQLFLSLLDADRFAGKFRDGVHQVDTTDLMRRMVKEELVKFDGTPLFPERRAYTVNYKLSEPENDLYEDVTRYVKEQMGKADKLDGQHRGSVGFALTALQRRLASSPAAIFSSLRRRRERLERRLQEERPDASGWALAAAAADIPEDDDDLDATIQEQVEDAVMDEATAARTVNELTAEVIILQQLERQAKVVVESRKDRKWEELSRIIQHDPRMCDSSGRMRKLIVFTEHRDTLDYLHRRITDLLGRPEEVVTIHGGTPRDERRRIQALFRSDPQVRVLVATDAAGEGVNLQNANLMVNYDLPWNPNRLEQRFGRIHRIGQQEVCHLWNLVADETREGQVYARLLQKISVENDALKGRVFDILGQVFDETSLQDLLIEAIRYGDNPEIRARLNRTVDSALDTEHLRSIIDRNALAQEVMGLDRLFEVKEEMERAQARRLQPSFVKAFFLRAFSQLKGTIHPREANRFEITHVPALLCERDRLVDRFRRRDQTPVIQRYARVGFTKESVQHLPTDQTHVELVHPGHPLMAVMTDLILDNHRDLLRQGAVFVHHAEEDPTPYVLVLLTHQVRAGDGSVLSERLQFVRLNPDGTTTFAGWAPHLDLTPLPAEDRSRIQPLLQEPWLRDDLERQVLHGAAAVLAQAHYDEITARHTARIDKVLRAVNERLLKEIRFHTERWEKYREDEKHGKDMQIALKSARQQIDDLQGRLDNRKRELNVARHVLSQPPVVLGCSLVIPMPLLRQLRNEEPVDPFCADAAARRRIELLAMDAVRRSEERRGCTVVDVSALKCGWDLTSRVPAIDGRNPPDRHIEVKGRHRGATEVMVTRSEIQHGINQGDQFWLAVVFVNEDDTTDGPYYISRPFRQEPEWGVSYQTYTLRHLLERAEPSL